MAAAAEEESKEASEPQQQIVFSLRLFQTLDQAQSFHGIPSQDYEQYHQYCTKRLYRIRHHKDVRGLLTHNAKLLRGSGGGEGSSTTIPKQQRGGRNAYCPRNLTPERITHEYILWNLLFQAERAWAEACAAQQTSHASTSMTNQKKKVNSHGIAQRHFNKAVKWAEQLAEVLQTRACAVASTVQESQAYLAWMKGNQALESKNYATAFREYSTSRKILLQLAANLQNNSTTATTNGENNNTKDEEDVVDTLALSDLWTTRAETVLKPLIRFCQYEAKDKLDASEITAAGLDNASSSSKSPTNKKNGITLEFRNKSVDLEAYPQLAVLYLKMEEVLENEGAQKDEKAFLQLLADLEDALRIVATESSRYASLPAGPSVTAKRSELATLKRFFSYHKLQLQRKHQEDTLLGDAGSAGGSDENKDNNSNSDADLFHFYDALQQNAQAVADLAGPAADDNDDYNPEDDPHWLEAQAHVVRIRAFRCYYLARLYETVLNGTTAQVLALVQQARMLQRRAAEEVTACELDDAGLQDLKIKISTMQCRVEASRYLELVGASSGIKSTQRPLWQRLEDLDAGPVIVDDPPVTIPLPCKPVFYDLAGTYLADSVQTSALDEYIQENEPKKQSSGGLFGWLSG